MMSAGKAVNTHAQDLVVNKDLLFMLKAFALCARLLHATRNA
jgi:hypothetical protein